MPASHHKTTNGTRYNIVYEDYLIDRGGKYSADLVLADVVPIFQSGLRPTETLDNISSRPVRSVSQNYRYHRYTGPALRPWYR